MKRITLIPPIVGLVTLAGMIAWRTLAEPGTSLPPFPDPPAVSLPGFEVPLGTARVAGVVRGADGRVLVEALVSLRAGEEPMWTYTDAEGRFALSEVHPGPARITILARRYRTHEFDVLAPDEALVLELDETLAPAPELPPLERAPLEGVIVPAIAGRGVAGYEVLLRPAETPDRFGAPVERRATVGADRSFRFDDLILGQYRVTLLPPWAAGGSWPNIADPARRAHVHSLASAGRSLELPAAAGELHARLVDADGAEIFGALALLHPAGSPDRPWPPATSAEDGTLTFADVPPGAHRLLLIAGEARRELTVQVSAGSALELDLQPLPTRAEH
ncbi:MAG: hypothetical protein CMJ84_17525 [Planctomycetes bacterium]|nr:hypothetical protein [Planctomycetota bacterium]